MLTTSTAVKVRRWVAAAKSASGSRSKDRRRRQVEQRRAQRSSCEDEVVAHGKNENKSVVWCKNTVGPPWPKRESKSVPFLRTSLCQAGSDKRFHSSDHRKRESLRHFRDHHGGKKPRRYYRPKSNSDGKQVPEEGTSNNNHRTARAYETKAG